MLFKVSAGQEGREGQQEEGMVRQGGGERQQGEGHGESARLAECAA